MIRVRALALVLAAVLAAWSPVAARKSVDLDSATVADLNAAFKAGTLTSERLVQLSIARIEAYDRKGPNLRAVLTLNPKALDTARALDAERKGKGPRSPLHGIPIVLKDNYDTFDLPTTGGSVLLEGSLPPDDAFVVKKLRDAGAIILAKVNLSEFASGGAFSSLGGQTRNPHDPTRSPSGSSGGTGVVHRRRLLDDRPRHRHRRLDSRAVDRQRHRRPQAHAWAAQPRRHHPARAELRHRRPDGSQRLRRARRLGVMTGIDPADAATKKSEGRFESDYTKFLQGRCAERRADWHRARLPRRGSRRRLGGGRRPRGHEEGRRDARRRALSASGCSTPRRSSTAPSAVPNSPSRSRTTWRRLGPKYPKTIAELIERAEQFTAHARRRRRSQSERGGALFKREARERHDGRTIATPPSAITDCRWCAPWSRAADAQRLDAIVYPTSSRRPGLIADPGVSAAASLARSLGQGARATNIANLTGFPDLIVPAGFTGDQLPVGLSFFGPAFSEGEAAGARLQLRTGDAGAAAAGDDAGARRRDAINIP